MVLSDVLRFEQEMNVRGWNQRDLASAAGLSESLVSKICAGGSARPSSLQRLTRALEARPVDPGLRVFVDSTLKINDPGTAGIVTGSKEPKREQDAGLVATAG